MGRLRKTVATLRIAADGLVLDEISKRLGCTATRARGKGWLLHGTDQEPGNLDAQIAEILGQLTSDLDVWRDITHTYDVNLFCGLFLDGPNEGETLSPDSLAALGARGIELQLDIYGSA